MSFFSGNNQWGGLLKQAISNVETTFDTLLEQPEAARTGSQDEETETYMDPISGMVTTVPKKKRAGPKATTTTTTSTPNSRPSTPKQSASTATQAAPLQRQHSDLSARLAAVMNEKKARTSTSSSRTTSIHSSQSVESPSALSSSVQQQDLAAATTTDMDAESMETPLNEKLTTKADETKNNILSTTASSVTSIGDVNGLDREISGSIDNSDVKDGDGSSNDNDDQGSKIDKDDKASENTKDLDDRNIDSMAALDSLAKDNSNQELVSDQPSNLLDATANTTSDSEPPTLDNKAQTKSTNIDDDDDDDDDNLLAGTTEMHLEPRTEGDGTVGDHSLEGTDESTSTNDIVVNEAAVTQGNDSKSTTQPPLDESDDVGNTLAPTSSTTSNDAPGGDLGQTNISTTTVATAAPPSASAPSPPADSSDKDRILAQREQQLLQAMETIAKLHDQIHSLQQDGDQATAHINSLQKRLQEQSTTQASSRNTKKLELTIQDLTKQLDFKEEQIQGLLKEGEKLSKNELKQTTTIKRLRTEKQDQDKVLADIQRKLDKANTDLSDLTTKSKRSSEGEKRAQDSIKMLTEMTERQTKHINKLETDSMHLKEQYQQLQAELTTTLENLEKEKNKAKVESEQVHAAALEKEVAANGRLHKELTTTKDTAQALETKLRTEIRELQIALQSLESQAGQREDSLRREVADIQHQLQKRDAHFDDISSNVEEATTPLLRQIEELQTQHSVVIRNRDQAEQSMNLKLQQTEKENKETIERLKIMQNEVQELKNELAEHQQHLTHSQEEKRHLETQLANTTLEVEALQKQMEERQQQLDEQKAHAAKTADDIKKQYQKLMRERLQEEKRQWDSKNRQQQQDHQEIASKKSTDTPSSPQAFASGTMPTSPRKEDGTSPIFRRLEPHSPSASSRSSFDSGYTGAMNQPSHAPSTIGVDRMQMTIRQMENQLDFYQTQLQIATQSRDEISDELTAMSQEMDSLRDECRKMQDLQKEHDDVNRRYQASLELLGERTEQVEELRADIADVKEMYRTQIVEMVQKIDQLSSNQK